MALGGIMRGMDRTPEVAHVVWRLGQSGRKRLVVDGFEMAAGVAWWKVVRP